MKRFIGSFLYRGQQITKEVWCKSAKQAAEFFECSVHHVRTYCSAVDNGDKFDGVIAYFDSGMLMRKEYSKLRVKMPLGELEKLIDKHMDVSYKKFKKRFKL